MSMSIVHDGYLERYADGTCLAQLADLPGCFMRGTSPDEAVQRLAGAIPAYYAWLARHDDYTPLVQGPFQVVAKEIQDTTPERGAFFVSDAAPVTAEDLDWYLALLGWTVADLVTLARALPAEVVDRAGTGGRSGSDALLGIGAHLARELAYVLSQPESAIPASTPLANVLEWLGGAVKISGDQLRAASDEECARVIERDGMRWSVRRVLRQTILDARIQLAALEAAQAS